MRGFSKPLMIIGIVLTMAHSSDLKSGVTGWRLHDLRRRFATGVEL